MAPIRGLASNRNGKVADCSGNLLFTPLGVDYSPGCFMSLRLNLHLRLGIIYLSAVLFFGIAAYLTVHVFTFTTIESSAVISQDAPVIRGLENIRQEVDEAVKSARIAMAGQVSVAVARDKLNIVTQTLDELRKKTLSEERPLFDKIETDWNAITSALERMKASGSRLIFQEEVLPLLSDLSQAINGMEELRRSISFERVQKIHKAIQQAHQNLLLFVSLLVLTGLGLAWGMRRYVLRPLRLLARATDYVARRDFDHQITPLRNDEIGDLIHNFNDMTTRLAKSEQEKKEFVSLVAHEMRTPLTVIRGYADLMVDLPDETSEKEKVEYLMAIQRETVNLQEMTDDLFDVARANAGAFRVEPILTDMAQALADFLKAFEHLAEEKKISFSWDVSNLPQAVVDIKRVGQALRNLVVNAFKFTPAGGRIAVTGRVQGSEMILEVTDNGPGIAPEELSNIFTRYYQVKVREGQERSGTGLGLAIVREIALAHGGRAEVESEMGRGTCFRIILPIQERKERHEPI